MLRQNSQRQRPNNFFVFVSLSVCFFVCLFVFKQGANGLSWCSDQDKVTVRNKEVTVLTEYTQGRFHCYCEIRPTNWGMSMWFLLFINQKGDCLFVFFPHPNVRSLLVFTRQTILFHFFQVPNAKALDFCIHKYFNHARTVQKLHEKSKYPILDVYSRDMIAKPRETLHKLCDYLNVTCYEEFVNSTLTILYSRPSKTRYSVKWTNEQKKRVVNEISKLKRPCA